MQKAKTELLQKFGEAEKFRIERGVEQVAGLWRSEDGSPQEFAEYCRQYFIADAAVLEAVFKKALQADPKNTNALYLSGLSYAKKKMYPEAIAAFEKVVAATPDFAPAHFQPQASAGQSPGSHKQSQPLPNIEGEIT